MYQIHHVQPATAAAQSVYLGRFLPTGPCLCVVKHTSLSFISLSSYASGTQQDQAVARGSSNPPSSAAEPLDEIFSLPINARILHVAAVPGDDAERLAVLTDHHSPRLFVLRLDLGSRQGPPSRDWAAHIITEATLPLDELGRQPAESGFALGVERKSSDAFAYAHTHAGILRIARVSGERQSTRSTSDRTKGRSSSSSQKHRASISSILSGDAQGSDAATTSISSKLARAFTARLPHPHLISSTFIDRRDAISRPAIALLSLSSTTSRLPGLGMQCLPVLSFHEIAEDQSELRPIPWLSSRRSSQAPSSPVQERRVSTSSRRRASRVAEDADAEEGTRTPRNQAAQQARTEGRAGRYGPAASGRTRTKEQEEADDEALSKTPLARAHVPLPFDDALGAHLVISLPVRAGGGVLVFSETTILHVPPPGDVDAQLANPPKSPTLSTAGKRRKGSSTEAPAVSAQQIRNAGAADTSASALSTSPTASFSAARSPANENGKRRRSTASSNNANVVSTPTTRRRSSAASTRSTSSMRLLRAKLGGPAITAAATVIAEPSHEEDDGVHVDAEGHGTVKVLFCTHAGKLNLLTVEMDQVDGSLSTRFVPTWLAVTPLGQVPAPGGPGALTYIGENFVHVASSSGDSVLVRIGNVSDEANASAASLDIVHRWSSLAPILDFAIDDGAGNDPAKEGSGQARIITCSGGGPDGSLRVVRNGVSMQEILSIGEGGVRRIWSITGKQNAATCLLVLGYTSFTRFLAISSDGIVDVTDTYARNASVDCNSSTLDVAQLAPGVFALINSTAACVLSAESPQSISSWASASMSSTSGSTITSAAINGAGQILLGTQGGTLALLQASVDAIRLVKAETLPSEVSALSLLSTPDEKPASIAAIGLWKPALVKLFTIPDLTDATPTALHEPQPSLVRSIALHTFSSAGRSISGPQLLLGLSDGSLQSMQLLLPSADSISKVIGVFEKRVAVLGTQPLHLRRLETSDGKQAVLVASDKATIVFSTGTSLTYSAIRHNDVSDACAFTYADEDGSTNKIAAFARRDQLALCKIGQIDKLDIATIPLGLDNPVSLTLCDHGKQVAVVTNAFLPEGRGTEPIAGGKVKLLDTQTFELMHEVQLEAEERPNCIKYFQRGEDKFIAIGTGYTFPDRSETHNGRINIFQVLQDGKKLALACSENVDGNVYDIEVLPDGQRLVAAVNAEVKSFDIDPEDETSDNASFTTATMQLDKDGMHGATAELTLTSVSWWSCAFTATSLRLLGPNRVLVGDALRSVVLLGIDSSGHLKEMARDCDPFWTVGCEMIDSENETYIGSDIAFNLFTCKRLKWSQSARDRLEQTRLRETETGGAVAAARSTALVDTTWSHIMQREAAFHYGDLVNTMKRGSLVRHAGQAQGSNKAATTSSGTEAVASPRIIFGTAAGAIGVIAKLNDRASSVLGQLSARLGDASNFAPVGGITTEDWRKLRTDHRTQAATGFIDGDAVRRQYDALSNEARAALLQSGNVPMTATVEEVNNLVEGMAHLS